MRRIRVFAYALLLEVSVTAFAAGDAEFAIRWDPADGGLQTAQEVLAALGLKNSKGMDFVVQYFAVTQPSSAAGDFRAVARERRGASYADATYKVRGPNPFPEAGPLHKWECPFSIPARSKEEVDISWIGEKDPQRAFSRSCTAEADIARAMPKEFGAKPLGCTSRMRRIQADGIKLEQWDLRNGRRLFEVSANGRDRPRDLDNFRRRIVDPLLSHEIRPLKDSKTELGSTC